MTREEKKLYMKRWGEANREHVRLYQREYRREHHKHYRVVFRKWCLANKEHRQKYMAAWRKKNKEHARLYSAAWWLANGKRWRQRNKGHIADKNSRACGQLASHYIANGLRVSVAKLPRIIIEAKRAQLMLLRETRRKS